jgi:hypothetical protein
MLLPRVRLIPEEAMRRFIALLVAVLATSTGWSVVEACGDKVLMVGRGARFQRAYASLHPGRILVYTSRTGATAAIRDEQLHKNLTKAGHTLTIAESAGAFAAALQAGSVDLVLADVSEAPGVDSQAAATSSKPTVVYVLHEQDKAKAAALLKQYSCPLKAGDKANQYLAVIEDAMKARGGSSQRQRRS